MVLQEEWTIENECFDHFCTDSNNRTPKHFLLDAIVIDTKNGYNSFDDYNKYHLASFLDRSNAPDEYSSSTN